MVSGRRLLIASAVGGVAIVVICLAVFLPRDHGEHHQTQPNQDASVNVLSDYSESDHDSIFEIGGSTSQTPIISTVSSSAAAGAGKPIPDGIAQGAQFGADDVPDCTVPLNSSLGDFIYGNPDCRVIFLQYNGPIGYNLFSQINITRPLTIIGNPIVRPIVRATIAPTMFRIFPNASLDVRYISFGMGIGGARPTYDGIFLLIRGGTFYVDFWGRLETTGCDISSPTVPEPLLDFADSLGVLAEIRMEGCFIFVEGGRVTLTRTDLTAIIAYAPVRRVSLFGGLILNMFGDVVKNQCNTRIVLRAVTPTCIGALLTSLDGSITVNGGSLEVAMLFSTVSGAGWCFYVGGGEYISRGWVTRIAMIGAVTFGTAYTSVMGGVLLSIGTTVSVAVGFMATLSAGQLFFCGGGIAIRVGILIAVAQLWAVFWGAGQLTFVGGGYSMALGAGMAACAVGFSYYGAGIFEYLGAGVYELIGINLAIFDAMGAIFAAGVLAFIGSGVVGMYGVTISTNIAMMAVFGKGVIVFLGAGHLGVWGFLVGPISILIGINPFIGIFYVGARIRRLQEVPTPGIFKSLVLPGLMLPGFNQSLLNNNPLMNDTRDFFQQVAMNRDPLNLDSYGYGIYPAQAFSVLSQSVSIVDFVVLKFDQYKVNEPFVKAVEVITGIPDYRKFASVNLLEFADGCQRRKLEVKRTLPKYKGIVQQGLPILTTVAVPAEEKQSVSVMPVAKREVISIAEGSCHVCNVTPISLVRNTDNSSCNRCTVSGEACAALQKAQKIWKKEDFRQITLIKGRLTIACRLKKDTQECVPKSLVERVLQRMTDFPQTGAGLIVSTDIVMKTLFDRGEVTVPLSGEEREGTECTHKTTYRVYGTATFDEQAVSLVGVLSGLGRGEEGVIKRFRNLVNETDSETLLCRIWMSQEVTSRTESLDPERTTDPNAVHPPGMGGSGRRLLEEGEPEAPKVEITVHECPDHTTVRELTSGDKIHMWFEGFDVGSDVVVQLMTHDGEREIPGKIMKVFPELVKAPAPVKWTGSFDFVDTPPGQYYFKVFHSDKPTYHFTYSDAFHVVGPKEE